LTKRYNVVKQEFLQHPNVLSATASMFAMGQGGLLEAVRPEGIVGSEWQMRIFAIDENFFETFEIELVAGRDFSQDIAGDAQEAFILNEVAVRQLGWTEPVGKQFEWGGRNGTVIGVVKDYHGTSLHAKIAPTVFCMWQPKLSWLSLKIHPENISDTLAFLEKKWKQFIPGRPFEIHFQDISIDRAYHEDRRFGQVFGISSLLAIFVAGLGLFGLTAFAIEQRTREIGIRKVLGASVSNIVSLLSRQFLVPVAAANIIAWPIAYYMMNGWLQNFAYRIDLGLGTFVLGGALTLVVVLLTVSTLVIKAARRNPVDALRYE